MSWFLYDRDHRHETVNESVGTLSIEILNKKSRNIIIAATFPPPKGLLQRLSK